MNLLEYYQSLGDQVRIGQHPDKDLYIVKYAHLGVNWSLPHMLDARGLILNSQGEVVARPYKKFFNYLELADREDYCADIRALSDWPGGEYEVQEKVDGSLIMIFGYRGELVFASSGSFTSEHALYARELYNRLFSPEQRKEIESSAIMHGKTLLFELVSPKYQIVLNYDQENLIFHDRIDTFSGHCDYHESRAWAESIGLPMVKRFDFTLTEMEELQTEAKGIEGFVVKFKSGQMLKIKTADYLEKAKDVAIFFGRFYTKRKLEYIVDAVFKGEFDDVVALAVSHPDIHKNLLLVNTRIQVLYKQLQDYRAKWASGVFYDRKDIALNPATAADKFWIFLALKGENAWAPAIKSTIIKEMAGN